ncbi:MAG: hypothetical protein LBS68_02105 [Puniceicoccales bacterium]|nr:hypothetical protein [Puniceicoccales bacterium]
MDPIKPERVAPRGACAGGVPPAAVAGGSSSFQFLPVASSAEGNFSYSISLPAMGTLKSEIYTTNYWSACLQCHRSDWEELDSLQEQDRTFILGYQCSFIRHLIRGPRSCNKPSKLPTRAPSVAPPRSTFLCVRGWARDGQ